MTRAHRPRLAGALPLPTIAAMAVALVTAAAARAGEDDHAGECAAATPVIAMSDDGEVARLTGVLEVAGDEDWFELQLRPGYLYRFDPWTLDCGLCPRARAIGPDCATEIARVESLGGPKVYWFLAPADGRVRIVVDSPFGLAGSYSVPINVIGGPFSDDHPSTLPSAAVVTAGEPGGSGGEIVGALEFGQDADMFVVEARPGAMYRLEAVEGLQGSSDLIVRFGPLEPWGTLATEPQIPGANCELRPEGCAAARVIAPAGGSAASRLYIVVEHRFNQREDLPALNYRLRLVDEGDFVAASGAGECDDAPDVTIGTSLATALPSQSFTSRYWSFTAQAGHVYRTRVEATVGALELAFGVLDRDCEQTLSYGEPLLGSLTSYFRAESTGPLRLFVQRTRLRVDPLNVPVPGWCVVGLGDLGPITDAEPDDPAGAVPFVAGGRIEPGRLDYAGDQDWFLSFLPAGLTYRVELRLCSDGDAAAAGITARCFAGPNSVAVPAARAAGAPAVWEGRSISTPVAAPLFVRIEPGPTPRSESPVCYELRVVRTDCRGDWDGSGVRDVSDLFSYLDDYFVGRGEFDDRGRQGDVGDLLAFVQAWFTPCP